MQRSGELLSEPIFPHPGNARSEERSSANQSSASLVTPKEPKNLLLQDGETRGAQLRSKGNARESKPQRSLSSIIPEENDAQLAQRTAKLSENNHPPQAAKEVLSYAKATTPSARIAQKRRSTLVEKVPPPPPLIANPGSGPGAPSPLGEATQGPSPVDYSLEIKVVFPSEMVIEMQRSAAQKTHKTVIERTLGSRASFKTL
jgi:hypothetical protein